MDFVHLLNSRPLVVGDGAMGTELFARGLTAGQCAELWNVERPDLVLQVHAQYVEAGADCILTNTFGGNPVALARHGLAERVAELNRAAVELARRAAGDGVLVVGDVGPTGELLEPYGTLTETDAQAAFAEQARALAEAGVDALIFETFESSAELAAALRGARSACDLPLVACMKFNPEPSGRYRSMMGEGPEQLVRVAEQAGCTAVGTNCGHGITTMAPLVAKIARLSRLPVLVEPNAGMPRLEGGRTVYPETPEDFARALPELHRAGARYVGGCCGTGPDHVRVIRAYADSLAGRTSG